MDPSTYTDPQLTRQDKLVIKSLVDDVDSNGEHVGSDAPRPG